MDINRIKQVISYGWLHAGQVQSVIKRGEPSVIHGRISIFFDIVNCYRRYNLWSNQYVKDKFYNMSEKERENKGLEYLELNRKKTVWTDYFYKNKKFFSKWGSENNDFSYKKASLRNLAYTKQYNMGEGCIIRSNVLIMSTHGLIGEIRFGSHCSIGRNTDIDYTGGLIIGNGVEITDGVRILTHNHDFFGIIQNNNCLLDDTRAYVTPLQIDDNVFIGSGAIIMPGISRIGENAIISSGAVVMQEVKPNTIVAGNPAKVIGKLPRVYYRYSKNNK